MRLLTIKQVILLVCGLLFLFVGYVTPGFLRGLTTYQNNLNQAEWLISVGVPESFKWYTLSEWRQGAGNLKPAPFGRGRPESEMRRNAQIVAHRVGKRTAMVWDFTFCQAKYRLPDGSEEVWAAVCPEQHVAAIRPYATEVIAGFFFSIGAALLLWCFLLPNRRMQPTPAGAANPER
jgi:hypothetical protein